MKEPTLQDVFAEIKGLRLEVKALRGELRKEQSPEFMTVEEAARHIKLSPKTIRNGLSDKNRPFPVKPCKKGRKGRVLFEKAALDAHFGARGENVADLGHNAIRP